MWRSGPVGLQLQGDTRSSEGSANPVSGNRTKQRIKRLLAMKYQRNHGRTGLSVTREASSPGTALKVVLAGLIGLTLVLGGSLGVAAMIGDDNWGTADRVEMSSTETFAGAGAAGLNESSDANVAAQGKGFEVSSFSGVPAGLWAAIGVGALLLAAFNTRKRREPRAQPTSAIG